MFFIQIFSASALSTIYYTNFGTADNINPASWIFTGSNMNIGLQDGSCCYANASGGAYLTEGSSCSFINTTGVLRHSVVNGTSSASIQLSTIGFSGITISFGASKSLSCSSTLTYTLEWSVNNVDYTPVSFNIPANGRWGIATGNGLSLPDNASNQPTLFLKWIFVRTGSSSVFKIDDFKIQGNNCSPASVITQPVSPSHVCAGTDTSDFNVGVEGTAPISYQWLENGIIISDNNLYAGTQSQTLQIINPPSILNEKYYKCTVSNCSGDIVVSDSAILSLNEPPDTTVTINGLPDFCVGDSVELNVFETTGSVYQWSSGETTSNIAVHNSGSYSVFITDSNGCSANSIPVIVITHHSPSDIDGNGVTDFGDFLQLLQKYNTVCSDCPEDINNDSNVNILDFLLLLGQFNKSCMSQ